MFNQKSTTESNSFFGSLIPPMPEGSLYHGQCIEPSEEWTLCVALRDDHYDEFFDATKGRVGVRFLARQTATGGYCLVIACQREGSSLQHRIVLSLHDETAKEFVRSLLDQRLVMRFQDARGQHENLSQDVSKWAQCVLEWSASAAPLSQVAELFGRMMLIKELVEPSTQRSLHPEKSVDEVGITVIQRRAEAPVPPTLQ